MLVKLTPPYETFKNLFEIVLNCHLTEEANTDFSLDEAESYMIFWSNSNLKKHDI